ncbi:MAG: hypothetical protein JWN86_3332 [Planctomycetota bacterium]|nr:hypothetical protein [Planctomycetota bacterium]
MLIAHHVAVELFGREFSPRTPFEHICTFAVVGLVFALAGYGAWTLAAKSMTRNRGKVQV